MSLVLLTVALALLPVGVLLAIRGWMPARTGPVQLLVVAAVSTAVVALLVYRFVGAPLRRVLGIIHRITEGDFESRTDPEGTGLFARVFRALDQMGGTLQARAAAVAASERRYRVLYEHSPAGLFRTRGDGRILDCNMAAVRMLGYDSIVDAQTRNARTYYAVDGDRVRVLEMLAREDVVKNLLVKLRRKDGQEIPVLLTVIRTQKGGVDCLEGEFIDARGLGPPS